jgi:hypothetical protein
LHFLSTIFSISRTFARSYYLRFSHTKQRIDDLNL